MKCRWCTRTFIRSCRRRVTWSMLSDDSTPDWSRWRPVVSDRKTEARCGARGEGRGARGGFSTLIVDSSFGTRNSELGTRHLLQHAFPEQAERRGAVAQQFVMEPLK